MHVTVCVCTRNRGATIKRTLDSIAALRYHDFDALIIDQSETDDTWTCFRLAVGGDPRFSYIRSSAAGLSRGRNIAVAHARGPIVAFTDDDCEVSPDWLTSIDECFALHSNVGLVSGDVRPSEYDPIVGYVPTFEIRRRACLTGLCAFWRETGIGANMAFHLDALHEVGPFDEILGAGAPLVSGEDLDMAYRIARAGFRIVLTPEAYITHYGFRTWSAGITAGSSWGIGGAYMKHFRLGDGVALVAYLRWVNRVVIWRWFFQLRWRSAFAFAAGCLRGGRESFKYGIDTARCLYRQEVLNESGINS